MAGDACCLPRTRRRSLDRHERTTSVPSTVAQHQMKYEMSNLPLTSEPNYGATTAHFSCHTTCHASPLTDNRPTDDAGRQISDRS
jgi:hypothetical protein